MGYPVPDMPDATRKPAPAGDGCSDEPSKGPFSQPSPASAGLRSHNRYGRVCPGKEVIIKISWKAKNG